VRRFVFLALLVVACSKKSPTFHGTTYEADMPDEWHAGTHPLADAARALADGTPVRADIQTLVDDQNHAIIVAEYTVGEPAKGLPAPQANLMGTVAKGVEVSPISKRIGGFVDVLAGGHVPSLTDELCARMFESLKFPTTAHKVDYGATEGCEAVSPDGERRLALLELGTQALVVMCTKAEADVDRACDRVLRSIHPLKQDDQR
jgi:hypothetical protein